MKIVPSLDMINARRDLQNNSGHLSNDWQLSYEVASLIRRMTFKRPENRLTIDEVLADDWIGDDEAFELYLGNLKKR